MATMTERSNLMPIPEYSIDNREWLLSVQWWLCNDETILVDWAEIYVLGMDFDDPADAGIDIKHSDIVEIADVLKRGNDVDGFYRA